MSKSAMNVTVPSEVKARIIERARLARRSRSSVVVEMLRAGLTDDPVARALAFDLRTNARLDKVIGEVLILKEVMLAFVRVWLEHNPPIDEAYEESAAASAEARFERFIAFVSEALRSGRPLGASVDEANGEALAEASREERAP